MVPHRVNDGVNEGNKNGLRKFQTGLFVSWEKQEFLLQIVQELLRTKFQTTALGGPRLSNGTCEITIQALQPSGANFAASKDLLVTYLNMIKESKPQIFIEQKPELIDLEASDNESLDKPPTVLDESVVIVDLDSSNNCDKPKVNSVNVGLFNSEVIVVDTVQKPKSFQRSTSSREIRSTSVLKESNQPSRKRKRNFGCAETQSVEIVEILDDEVIVVEDSFTTDTDKVLQNNLWNNKTPIEKTIINKKPIETVTSSKQSDFENNALICTRTDPPISVCGKPFFDSRKNTIVNVPSSCFTLDVNKTVDVPVRAKTWENFSIDLESTSISSSSLSPTKKSKFSYKRPAHLITPLIQSNPSDASKVEITNIYNPNRGSAEKRTGLRPIVIDGNNVAIGHGKGQFSIRGIQICINYFEKRGHRQIKAFVPQYRRNKESHDELQRMERQGTIVFTPSRKVNGKVVASYDDRYIVQYAAEFGGVIVSTDNYRDLLNENASWKKTIENRLLMFTWVDDLLMFPQDPLGRKGPTLDDFLKFPDS